MRPNRNLVIVRCGDKSLHRSWIDGPRNWDLVVSYFGSDPTKPFPEAVVSHYYKGGKWDGLHDFFRLFPHMIDSYDYFWLPDDDIGASTAAINAMFDFMTLHKLELAQPSLSSDSYLSHLICAWNPIFEYRLVTFVEIMVPLLHVSVMRRVIPLLGAFKSGFGLDFVWQRFTSDPLKCVAIIDQVRVTHTRPVGGALKQMLAREGQVTAGEEEERFLASFNDVTKAEFVLGGRLWTGAHIKTNWIATTLAAIGWAMRPSGRHYDTYPLPPLRFLVWVARHWRSSIAAQIVKTHQKVSE